MDHKAPGRPPWTGDTDESDAAAWSRVGMYVAAILTGAHALAWFAVVATVPGAGFGAHFALSVGTVLSAAVLWLMRRVHRSHVEQVADLEFAAETAATRLVAAESGTLVYREILQETGVGWYRLDSNGHLVAATPATSDLLGYDSVEALKEAYRGKVFPASEHRAAVLNAARAVGEVRRHAAHWPSADGRDVPVRDSVRTLRDEEGTILFIEGFVSTGSGDPNPAARIRTPDTLPVRSAPESPPDMEEGASGLAASGPGSGVPERAPVAPLDCIEDAVEAVAGRVSEKDIDLAWRVAPNVPASILSDAQRIRQVLRSLVENALRFTERGEISLKVDSEPNRDGTHTVTFSVRDSGVGITPERLKRLFEVETGADASIGPASGLAACRLLAGSMGGRMWVESRPGEGSTFHFTVVASEGAEVSPIDLRPLAGLRVLVLDDNSSSRSTIVALLESLELHVHATNRADLAEDLLGDATAFDAALISLGSAATAVAFAARIRQRSAATRVPMLVVGPPGTSAEPVGLERVHRIAWPVRRARLAEVLQQLVEPIAPPGDWSEGPGGAVPGEDQPVRPAATWAGREGRAATFGALGDRSMGVPRAQDRPAASGHAPQSIRQNVSRRPAEDPGVVEESVSRFLQAGTIVETMARAADRHSLEELRAGARSLHEVALGVGVGRLATLCKVLEMTLEGNPRKSAVEPLVRAVEEAYRQAVPIVETQTSPPVPS